MGLTTYTGGGGTSVLWLTMPLATNKVTGSFRTRTELEKKITKLTLAPGGASLNWAQGKGYLEREGSWRDIYAIH